MSPTRGGGSFRTRRGRCVVAADEIRIEESVRGHLRTVWVAYNRRASLLTHAVASLLVVAVAGSAVLLNRTGDPWAAAFDVVLVVYLLLVAAVVVYVRFVSDEGTERIPHDDVVEVRAVRGGGVASPPRFVVVHRVGSDTRRRVVLPTTPGGDDGETYDDARRAFRGAGYVVREG